MLQQQPVGALAGLQVQGAAHAREELGRGVERLSFAGTQQARGSQRFGDGPCEPAQRRLVPQSARTLLQLGLQRVARGPVARVTTDSGVPQAPREAMRIRAHDRQHAGVGGRGQLGIPGHVPEVEHGRERIDAPCGDGRALLRGPDRLAHLHPGVPQGIQEIAHEGGEILGRGARRDGG